MNHFKFRTLLITAVALTAAQASLASGCRWPCDPPTPRNGWQPADSAKALPQTAAVQAAPDGSLHASPSDRNGVQPTKAVPGNAASKARLRLASGH